MKPIIEYSDDKGRASLTHIAKAITEVRSLGTVKCSRCRLRSVTHYVPSMRSAVCDSCAGAWATASPLERARYIAGLR